MTHNLDNQEGRNEYVKSIKEKAGLQKGLTTAARKELTQAEVVKKWMFYCWNFDSRLFHMEDSYRENDKVYAPSCFEALNYNKNLRDHLIEKWQDLSSGGGGSMGLIKLYFEMNTQYREDMVNYIMLNYNGA